MKEALPPGVDFGSDDIRKTLLLVLFLNLAVVAVKVVAWVSSGALSVAAEAAHSSLDALNNVFALAFASVAMKEPDEDHPYGHQKFETLGALFLVGLLSITVFELLQGAVLRLIADVPPPVEATPLAVAIMAGSAVVGLLISAYETRKGRDLDSDLLLADAAHTRSDVFAALAVLGGLVAVRLGIPEADPWITLGVAGLIGHTGWQILQEIVPVLVDERAVEARRIRRVARETEGVLDCYSVRSRGRPGEVFAELTITVSSDLDVSGSHRIADAVEERVERALEARKVVVHVEPDDEAASGSGSGGEGPGRPGRTGGAHSGEPGP